MTPANLKTQLEVKLSQIKIITMLKVFQNFQKPEKFNKTNLKKVFSDP